MPRNVRPKTGQAEPPRCSSAPTRGGAGKPKKGARAESCIRPLQANSPPLTTQQGIPVADDQNTLRIGARGPALLEDFHFREKIFHFDHERIPERVVHARGYGAHGFFETDDSLSDVTRADLFQRVGERTPAFVRFSTVAGSKGSFDLARDVRGFAVKLYTKEGNWDLVGNNIPVFFIQDAIKFPDLIHAVKPEPDRAFPAGAVGARQLLGLHLAHAREHAHDHVGHVGPGHPAVLPLHGRFRRSHLPLLDAEGPLHLRQVSLEAEARPAIGRSGTKRSRSTAPIPISIAATCGTAIQSGDFPEWELGVQLFDQKFADKFDFDVLDPTKLIPEEILPDPRRRPAGARPHGRQLLRRDRAGRVLTQNVPPGIDFSATTLCCRGATSRTSTRRSNGLAVPTSRTFPINAPRCPFAHFQQDGHMAMRNPEGPRQLRAQQLGRRRRPAGNPRRRLPQLRRTAEEAQKFGCGRKASPITTARRGSSSSARRRSSRSIICDALVFELSKVERPDIRERMVSHLCNIHDELAGTVANGLGIELPEPAEAAQQTRDDLPASAALSIVERGPERFEGRKLGILANGRCGRALSSPRSPRLSPKRAVCSR